MTQDAKQQELTAAIAADYEVTPKPTLVALSNKYKLHPLTVRKHLVTADVYDTAKMRTVLAALKIVQEKNFPYDQIMPELERLLSNAGAKGKPMSPQTIYPEGLYSRPGA